jgi:Tat protein secretion system quality control protein TatD with DNase activity
MTPHCRLLHLAFALFAPLAVAAEPSPLPIFDAHLHYNDEAAAPYPVPDVLRRFRESGVTTILATSRPNDGTRALVAAAAADPAAAPRVVPFLRPYRTHADRQTWFNDPAIYALIEDELARGIGYRGIGEFHVFGRDADTPWVKRIVALAVARGLWLHAHCDDEALEILFAHDPRVRIVWAHTGFSTPPAKVAQYLGRYPGLVGELSYRYDVTEDGVLTPAWRALFLAHPDRFVVGSDTWVNERWARYGEIVAYYRGWLGQLPPAVAAKIASGNGERLFPPTAASVAARTDAPGAVGTGAVPDRITSDGGRRAAK